MRFKPFRTFPHAGQTVDPHFSSRKKCKSATKNTRNPKISGVSWSCWADSNTRIAGVDLPRDKRVEIGLTYIYGIGKTSAIRILADAGVDPDTRVRDLTQDDVKKISEVIDETQVVEGDLRREIQLNIKRLKEIGCYRGIRHRKGLPVRGQKTKTNARTCKGPKRTVANKKK